MAPQTSLQLLARARKLGPHAAGARIALTVGLKLRNERKLKAFLGQVQNRESPLYRQWLAPEQFTERYGPGKSDVARVVAFLKAHGIAVKNVSANRVLIHTEATTAVYEHAFGIQINDYELNGRRFFSTADSPRLPRAIAPLLSNILGLNHGQAWRTHHYFRPVSATAGRVSPHEAPPPALTGFNPLQIATAYEWPDITDASNGADVTIGIVTAQSADVSAKDYDKFWNAFNLPEHQVTLIPVDGGGTSDPGSMGETLLDIEMSGAMAPGAKLRVYDTPDALPGSFTDAFNQLVEENKADVMTVSWGHCDAGSADLVATDEEIFKQGVSQGISMFAAAGDSGAADSPCQGGNANNNSDYPSSSAYVTAANGTQLTISKLDGTYGSEAAWNDSSCFGQGPAATGGGISSVVGKPDWQTGPGIPGDVDKRMNSDLAMDASCSHPLLTYMSGSWRESAGTSAVAPMLAGLFAIGVTENGARLGQSNSLIYGDVTANDTNYGTDFHDVTNGCNGKLPDGSDSCAAANWDHPTGWGSPKATSLLAHIGIQGPKGKLEGTVTSAASGSAIAGAKVVAVRSDGAEYETRTANDGTYSRVLPVGDFTITVKDYGYTNGTASVSIADSETVTQDFALNTASRVTLSGKVSDGSGHGYGLYAEVKVNAEGVGPVADVWTDPATGRYSVKLPTWSRYTIEASAAFDGYETVADYVKLESDKTENVTLKVTPTCSAPGYRFAAGGFGQDFNGSTFPPEGWQAANAITGSPVIWKLNTGWGDANFTGGTGTAADIDSGAAGPAYKGPHDSALVTPPIPVTSLHGAMILTYQANFQSYQGNDTLHLDISTDGGNTWTNILYWTDDHGTNYDTPGESVHVNLASYLPSSGTFRLRWRDYDVGNFHWDYYAQIDDVAIGHCAPIPGGLITGRVTNADTGDGFVGARVGDDLGESTRTVANASDPNLKQGSYLFFVKNGKRSLTASFGRYGPATAQVTVPKNGIVQQDFALKAAEFKAMPSAIELHVKAGGSATTSFALRNVGDGAGRFGILGVDSPSPATGAAATPVRHVRLKHPEWANKTLTWIRAHAKPGELRPAYGGQDTATGASNSVDTPWLELANYPRKIGDNLAAFDVTAGKLYSISGVNNQGGYQAASFMYDPRVGSWSPIADIPTPREGPVGAFINGKLYVTGGIGPPGGGPFAYQEELDIYDPATDQWSTGAHDPSPTTGTGVGVVNGKLYLVGGSFFRGSIRNVYVYDPETNRWSQAANYPHPVSFVACGGVAGKLYCAGGFKDAGGNYTDGYRYDPASNAWSPIADIPIQGGVGGALYAAAGGQLLLAGGFVGPDAEATNQIEAYDPATDSWYALTNAPNPVARGGGSCGATGFYNVGSVLSIGASGFTFSDRAQKLPGFSCSGGGIPWMTATPAQNTLAPGAAVRVTLSLSGSAQKKFTTTKGYLMIAGSPYTQPIVPITVHWDSQPVDLAVTGNVTPIGSVHKGQKQFYTLDVANLADAKGSASRATLTYTVPEGASYISSEGADCKAASAGSSSAAVAATVIGPASVVCDLGTLAAGASKRVKITSQVTADVDTLSGTFTATAREPDSDSANNSLTLKNASSSGPAPPTSPGGSSGGGGFALSGIVLLALLALSRMLRSTPRVFGKGAAIKGGVGFAVVLAFAFSALPMPASAAFVSQVVPRIGDSVTQISHSRTEALPPTLRSVFYRAMARDVSAVYNVSDNSCADVSNLSLKACFDRGGVRFTNENTTSKLHLDAWGRGGHMTAAKPVEPTIKANRVSYARGDLTEWWRVLPVGFEQGFTVAKRPSGQGKLRLLLGVSRQTTHKNGALGWDRLRYGDLVVTDAKDKVVPARLKRKDDRILIAVNDAHATYPLTVDPLVWIAQQVTASDGAAHNIFSYTVAMDGKTALISAPWATVGNNVQQGVVYVFTESDGVWSKTQKLVASNGAAGDQLGKKGLALSGGTAIVTSAVSTVNGNIGEGEGYVFTRKNGKWKQTQILVASDGQQFGDFGQGAAMDGDTAFIAAGGGAVRGVPIPGSVYVFNRGSNGVWTETQKISSPNRPGDEFGFQRSMAMSGSTAVVGAFAATVKGNAVQGNATVYTKSNGHWVQRQQLTAGSRTAPDFFGTSVAIDGTTVLIGAEAENNGGAAYVFTESGGRWVLAQRLIPDDWLATYSFGSFTALSGNVALIGAIGYHQNVGKAYVYTRSNGTWSQAGELFPNNQSPGSFYGYSGALSGSAGLIGQQGATVNGNPSQGTAYFYGRDDLGLAVSVPRTVKPGAQYVSQAIATNNSSIASPAVAVTITVPANASIVSATASQGDCSEDSGTVTCGWGQIGGNAGTAVANVTLKASASTGRAIRATAGIAKAAPALTAGAATLVTDNHPPVAKGGSLKTEEGRSESGTLHASDKDGDALTFTIVGQPKHGKVKLNDVSSGAYTYRPGVGYAGNDSFTFKANDGTDDSNTATVSITVKAVKPPPDERDNGGGGGALGWLGLAALLGLALVGVCARSRRVAS